MLILTQYVFVKYWKFCGVLLWSLNPHHIQSQAKLRWKDLTQTIFSNFTGYQKRKKKKHSSYDLMYLDKK